MKQHMGGFLMPGKEKTDGRQTAGFALQDHHLACARTADFQ
jgi:hypothetical protein